MGRASSYRGARPICLPFLTSEGVPTLLLSPLLLRIVWLCSVSGCHPHVFDSLYARYARHRILCARLGLFARVSRRSVVVLGRVVVRGGFHVWVCGPSGILLGCERGRAGSTLASFFEAATMPERSAAHQGRGQAHLRVLLNDRTIRHHRVNAGVNKRKKRKQGEAVTCR